MVGAGVDQVEKHIALGAQRDFEALESEVEARIVAGVLDARASMANGRAVAREQTGASREASFVSDVLEIDGELARPRDRRLFAPGGTKLRRADAPRRRRDGGAETAWSEDRPPPLIARAYRAFVWPRIGRLLARPIEIRPPPVVPPRLVWIIFLCKG